MQFLVIGYDGTDKDAKERRQKARPAHIALGDELVKKGNVWFGAALTDNNGEMIGSAFFMNFPSRKELDDYLAIEPYVTGGVWKKIDIKLCDTRDPWQFSHPREWFEKRITENEK